MTVGYVLMTGTIDTAGLGHGWSLVALLAAMPAVGTLSVLADRRHGQHIRPRAGGVERAPRSLTGSGPTCQAERK